MSWSHHMTSYANSSWRVLKIQLANWKIIKISFKISLNLFIKQKSNEKKCLCETRHLVLPSFTVSPMFKLYKLLNIMIDWITNIFLFYPKKMRHKFIELLNYPRKIKTFIRSPKIAVISEQLRSSDFVIGKQETRHEVHEKKKIR